MCHLDRRERFDHHLRMALLETAEHVHVVLEPQLGMQPAHDVKLTRGVVSGRVRFGEHFFEAARVGAILFGHARERAEDAGGAQDADVGGVDVLIGREVDALAVLPPVSEIGEATDREQVRRSKKRETILAREPLAAFDLLCDRSEAHATLRTASVTSCPPHPNELDSATSICRFTAWFGAESRSQAGSGLN